MTSKEFEEKSNFGLNLYVNFNQIQQIFFKFNGFDV